MNMPPPTTAAVVADGAQGTAHPTSEEFAAAFPPQYTILGVKLLPLSLGRYRLMKWAGVAFVSEEECGASVEDLFTGLAICGMPCGEFKQFLNDGKLESELRAWGELLREQIAQEKGFNIFEKITLFQRYIEDGQKLPWVPLPVQTENPPDYTSTHWSLNVEVVLRGHLNWTKDEIDEEPLTKALCDYFKWMEGEGHVRLMPHELYQAMLDEGEANMRVMEKRNSELKTGEAICQG